MKQYQDLLRTILKNGERREDRTGVGTISTFGEQIRFDLSEGFPLQTTKHVSIKSIIGELLWFISGSTNIKDLHKYGITIWDEWAVTQEDIDDATISTNRSLVKVGDLGPIYGSRWREWCAAYNEDKGVYMRDQLGTLIQQIKDKPFSRRHIITAWDPTYLPDESKSPQQNVLDGKMALAPCHTLFQFYVSTKGTLSCKMYQRSADVFLGVPYNIASYAALTMMVAKLTGLTPGELIISFGDAHIYLNHLDQVNTVLSRTPKPLPKLILQGNQQTIDDFKLEDFQLFGYNPDPKITAPIAI